MFNHTDNLKTMRQAYAKAPGADRLSAIMLRIVDGGLAGVIFAVPFVMGGRHPLGQLILSALAVITTSAWAIRQSIVSNPTWRPTWALALIFAGASLLVLQIIPLPQALLERLAPGNAHLLPLWNSGQSGATSFGRWPFISFTPDETQASLILFLTYGLLFFVTVQRIKAIEDLERLLRWCAISAVCMAVFGLVQYFAGNGKFFWFYTHPFAVTYDGAKGSFSNKNHFAHFLALGVGPLIWWMLHVSRQARPRIHNTFFRAANINRWGELKTYFLGLALAVVLFAGLMSLSRGGMAALCLAAVVSTALCYRASAGAGRFLGILLASCVLIGAALSIFGLDQVGRRLETLTSGETVEKDRFGGRIAIWSAAVQSIPDHFWLGSGAGSFREVYPIHADGAGNENIEVTHAENSYLQDILETGVIGFGLLIAGVALLGYWCMAGWNGPVRLKVCAGAIAGSLAAGTAQALVDFVWYVPACMAIMAVLAACALRAGQFAAAKPDTPRTATLWRPIAVAVAIILLPIGAWMIHNRIGPAMAQPYWDQYLISLREQNSEPRPADNMDSTARRNTLNAAVQRENKLIECLEKVVYWQPAHASAQLALAEAHLRLFDNLQATSLNPMTLVNIRDAALSSEFSSREAVCDWMARALGDHWLHLDAALRHTRKTLALCPLQGRGYVCLAKLCFLDGKKGFSKQTCMEQALRVRPFDGFVVYTAAAEAFLDGNTRQWLELSKRAYHCGREYRQQLIANLVGNTSPAGLGRMIDFIITQFQPDFEGLQFLYTVCVKRCSAEQLLPLCQYQALRAEYEAGRRKDSGAAKLWLEAQRLHTELKNGPRALECARRALECDQYNHQAHYQLALCLMDQGLFAEAESHLHWCLLRTPNDKSLEIKLKEALKGRLDAERCATAQKRDNY